MPHDSFGIDERTWTTLCRRVAKGEAIPVVGSRLRAPLFPLPEELAYRWAKELEYPLANTSELALVAQYARENAPDVNALLDDFKRFTEAQYSEADLDAALDTIDMDHPIRRLAELPFDTYITTTYDGLLAGALRKFRPNANPIEISCLWRPEDRGWDFENETREFYTEASLKRPIVFHLHGRLADSASMVLTEADHMVFTARLSANETESAPVAALFPPAITDALAKRSWLFLGYGAADHNFRGLLRALGERVQNRLQVVAVQLQKGDAIDDGHREEADTFLTSYFQRLLDDRPVEVVVTDARGFLLEVQRSIDDLKQPAA